MLGQLIIGTLVIVASVVVQAVFIGVAEAVLGIRRRWYLRRPHAPKLVAVVVGVTLWLMAAHTVSVWLWAGVFLAVGAFETLEPALYFAVVAFTTLGFGDILLPQEWRLLSGLSAANGLLIFGVSTAFLVEALRQVRRAQAEA